MEKEFLIMQVDERIRLTKELVKDLYRAIEVVNTFNNKVYNKRLVSAIQGKIANDVYQDSYYKNRLVLSQKRGNELTYKERSYYLKRRDVYLFITLTDNRIDSEKTVLNIQNSINQELKNIEELKESILLFDKEKQERDYITKLAQQYEKKYPKYIKGAFSFTNYKYEI
ncbi:hypothetical protein [uncultured Bacteroides sp.]|jgi:hypothetical protein|uniref:hypothetical protein n=1 Tax=uncultured Bacteroides sp. TaxID=162156 RepID=UPI00258A2086|nr:hypothetical protein [uncultured Bacteroides sp.]